MKIGLIDPGSKKLLFNENFPHIGLAYVAAVLAEHGHEPACLDVGLQGQEQTERFLQRDFDVIGLSVTSFSLRDAVQLARRSKAIFPDRVIVLGGPHVPIGMEETLADPAIDYAVIGEGEFTMLELADLLEARARPDGDQLSKIDGLMFRRGNDVVANKRRRRIEDLDALPFPAFDLFPMKDYGMYPLLTSRGCPFGCSFCSIKAIWGRLWRRRSPDSVVREIHFAREHFDWNAKPFNVIDDSFNVDVKRVMAFCDRLSADQLGIQWFSSGFRADHVPLDLARKMRQTGCIGVSVGIESANNDVLRSISKKANLAEITEGCRNLAGAGIPVQAQFMIGNPGDTYETVMESIELAKREHIAHVAFYLALPYPKTELWDYVQKHGRFIRDDYTQFHHFSNEPVFDTPEFPASQRSRVYSMGRRLSVRTKLKHEIRTKVQRICRMDFTDLSVKRVSKAVARMGKYLLDIALRRDEAV